MILINIEQKTHQKHILIKILHPYPALLLEHENKKNILIADLHIGFEQRFVDTGININTSTKKIENNLKAMIKQFKPHNIIMLGDVKDSITRISTIEKKTIPLLFHKLIDETNVTIVRGNHDAKIETIMPKEVNIEKSTGIRIGNTALFHGHTRLNAEFSEVDRVIMGHLHPTYSRKGNPVSGSQSWISLRVKKKYIFETKKEEYVEIIVLPAFNTELTSAGFTSKKGRIISPLIRKVHQHIDEVAISSLKGDIIGNKNALKYVL